MESRFENNNGCGSCQRRGCLPIQVGQERQIRIDFQCSRIIRQYQTLLGWVPADLLAEVGQNEVYHIDYSRYRDSLLCAVNLMYPDTLALHNANIQGTMLFNLDGNPAGPMTNGNIRLNYPLSVWDKNWNKIINIKGGDIMVSDVRKMEAENKNVNIHLLFNDADLPYLSPYINVLQNLKLKMKPGYDYTFSATCISSNGENRHLAPTKDFSAWLGYIKQSISSKRKNEQEEQSSFYGLAGLSNKSPVMITKAVSATMYLSF